MKYLDELDYVVDGLMNGEIFESLALVCTLLKDERLRMFAGESRHLNEIVQILLEREVLDPHICAVALDVILQCFNPYSFVNLPELFGILLVIFDSLLLDGSAGKPANIGSKARKIRTILEKIPIRWYKRYSGCAELEKLVYGLQICIGKKMLGYSRFVCSMLRILYEFELEEGFIVSLLEVKEDYEILVNYTMSEENIRKLGSGLKFMSALKEITLKELGNIAQGYKDIDVLSSRDDLSSTVSDLPASSSGPNSLRPVHQETSKETSCQESGTEGELGSGILRSLLMILINLADKSYYISIPVNIMEKAYCVVDGITRYYLAIFLLISHRVNGDARGLSISAAELKREVKELISHPGLSENMARRLEELVAE